MVQDAFVHVRIESKLDEELMQLSHRRMAAKSDIVREALTEYLRKEQELNEIRGIVAKKFSEGKLSFEKMAELLGYKQARKVAFFVEVAEKSFEEGLR